MCCCFEYASDILLSCEASSAALLHAILTGGVYTSLADGGLVANNPTMVAMSLAMTARSKAAGHNITSTEPLPPPPVLSIGCGSAMEPLFKAGPFMEPANWAISGLLSVLFGANVEATTASFEHIINTVSARTVCGPSSGLA
jgi:hypothetical protein